MATNKNNPFAPFVDLDSHTSLDGDQFLIVRTADHHGYVPAVEFGGGGAAAMKTLEKFNIVPLPETSDAIMAAVRSVSDFPVGAFLARPGSTPPYFALQDGTVFHPASAEPAETIFPLTAKHFAQAGTLAEWRRYVAGPLVGNPRAQAIVAMPLAAVIAELYEGISNLGFELVGPPATGKTTALMLAASVMGGAVDRETSYMVSMNATANGLEAIVPAFKNTLLVLEEGQLFSASDTPRAKATKWREFGHRLADGTSKLRGQYGDRDNVATTSSTPLWFLLNSNESLADVLGGGDTDADRAVLQRIQTLPANGKFGVYDRLPDGVIGGAAFSDSLQSAMRRYHGTAIRAFLQGLAELRDKGEPQLRKRISLHMKKFETEVRLDPNDGEASRAAKAFGLIYVSVRLGKHLRVLPASWDPLRIALRCHTLNRAAVLNRRPFKARLESYASRRDLVQLEPGKIPNLSNEEVSACPGFIKKRAGGTVLLMSVDAYKRAFPDSKKLKGISNRYMQFDKDGEHHPKQLIRRNGPKVRLVTFMID